MIRSYDPPEKYNGCSIIQLKDEKRMRVMPLRPALTEPSALFAQMIQSEVNDSFHVLVGKGIEHILPVAAELDEVR